jgi:hypothetical protein
MVLICISLMISDIEYLVIYLLATSISSLEKHLLNSLKFFCYCMNFLFLLQIISLCKNSKSTKVQQGENEGSFSSPSPWGS